MARGTRSTRQSSRSPKRWGDLIDPLLENGYDDLFAQQRALLAAVDAVPTPASPAVSRRLGAGFLVPDEDLDAAVAAGGLISSPTPAAIRSNYEDIFSLGSEPRASERASASRRSRSRSVTSAQRRAPVGSTPTRPAQGPPILGNWFGLPVYFDPSIPRAPTVSAAAGGEPSPNYYTPTSPAYQPYEPSVAVPSPSPVPSPAYSPFSPAYDPNAGVIATRLDALERLQRRVDLRTDRIEAQLVVVIDALVDRRNGAAPAATNDRKRKRSADGRNVIDLTGATQSPKSPKKVDFVDLVTDSSWSGSRFSSDSSTSSSDSSSSSSSSSDNDDDDDKPSTPSKKSKSSPERSPSSPRSPRTPPNNHTPSPPRTPRKAPPRRPPPRTPPRQRAPSMPSTPPAPRKARGASRSPAPQAPRTPPQQAAPARPATPPAPRRSARIPKSKQREVEPRAPAPSRVTTRGQAKASKAAPKPRPNPTTYVRRKRT